jgi:hypothetical protein
MWFEENSSKHGSIPVHQFPRQTIVVIVLPARAPDAAEQKNWV